MMDSLLMHICVTRPQWVKESKFVDILWQSWQIDDHVMKNIMPMDLQYVP